VACRGGGNVVLCGGFACDANGIACESKKTSAARAAARQGRMIASLLAPAFLQLLPVRLSNPIQDKEEDVEFLFLVAWFANRPHSISSSWSHTRQHRQNYRTHHHPLASSLPAAALPASTPPTTCRTVDKAACYRRPCVDLLLLRFVIVDHRCKVPLLASASKAFIPHPTSSPCICWAGRCMSCMPRAFSSSHATKSV